MFKHFNKLTPGQAERLAMLAEECAEVIVEVNKALRHGLDSYHPDNPGVNNRDRITKELIDVEAVLKMMYLSNDFTMPRRLNDVQNAFNKKLKYAHHQQELKDLSNGS